MKYLIIFIGLILISCTSTKYCHVTKSEDGYPVMRCDSIPFDLRFYGDYLFENLKERTTVKLPTKIDRLLRKRGAELQFEGYTRVESYASVRVYWTRYVQNTIAIDSSLKLDLELDSLKTTIVQTGPTISQNSFQFIQKKDNLNFDLFEYSTPKGILHLLFWTEDSPAWLSRESKAIINTNIEFR